MYYFAIHKVKKHNKILKLFVDLNEKLIETGDI